jgi:hypothetical protein
MSAAELMRCAFRVLVSQLYDNDRMTVTLESFYFGVLHPVARTLSRLLEDPSVGTSLQSVSFIFYIFLRYMFLPLLAILRWNTQLTS